MGSELKPAELILISEVKNEAFSINAKLVELFLLIHFCI